MINQRATSKSGAHLRTLGVAVTVATLLISTNATAFDAAAFLRGCTNSCEPQWKNGTKDASSPAFGMSDDTIKALCACSCEAILNDLSPRLRDALADALKRNARLSPDATKQYSDLAMKAMAVCVPKYETPPKR